MQTGKGWESYTLIYSAAVTVKEAKIYAFNLANKKQIDDLAHSFRRSIFKSIKESQHLPWPPTPEYFDSISIDKQIPKNVSLQF